MLQSAVAATANSDGGYSSGCAGRSTAHCAPAAAVGATGIHGPTVISRLKKKTKKKKKTTTKQKRKKKTKTRAKTKGSRRRIKRRSFALTLRRRRKDEDEDEEEDEDEDDDGDDEGLVNPKGEDEGKSSEEKAFSEEGATPLAHVGADCAELDARRGGCP